MIFHSSIKLATGTTLLIPVEVEVIPRTGLYVPGNKLDFETGGHLDPPAIRPLHLCSSAKKPVTIEVSVRSNSYCASESQRRRYQFLALLFPYLVDNSKIGIRSGSCAVQGHSPQKITNLQYRLPPFLHLSIYFQKFLLFLP